MVFRPGRLPDDQSRVCLSRRPSELAYALLRLGARSRRLSAGSTSTLCSSCRCLRISLVEFENLHRSADPFLAAARCSGRQPFQPIPQAAKPGACFRSPGRSHGIARAANPCLCHNIQHSPSQVTSPFHPVAAFADRTNIGSALSVCPGLRLALLATSPTLLPTRCHPDLRQSALPKLDRIYCAAPRRRAPCHHVATLTRLRGFRGPRFQSASPTSDDTSSRYRLLACGQQRLDATPHSILEGRR